MRQRHRILLVLETSGGGSGRHVIDLARECARLGHRVHIAYSGRRMESWFYQQLCALASVEHVQIDIRRSPHPGDLLALKALRKYILATGPFDVIHGHSTKGGALARLAALGCGAIRIYTPHALRSLDPSLNLLVRRLYAGIEYALHPMTDGIILVSEEERAHALQCKFPLRKLFVVHNGLTPRGQAPVREKIRERLGLAENAFCVGFVARLVPQKAPQRIIEAFAIIARRFPLARLVLLGDGPLAPRVHALAEQAGVMQKIIWLVGEEGTAMMPAFDVFVMPSLYEAFPYVLIEAAAAGLPIVATAVGGTQAVVSSGKNGFIVPHGHPQALADALATLLQDAALRQRMAEASRETARSFTVKAMTAATLAVYERVLAAKGIRAEALSH